MENKNYTLTGIIGIFLICFFTCFFVLGIFSFIKFLIIKI